MRPQVVDAIVMRQGIRHFQGHHLSDAASFSAHYCREWELPLSDLRMSPNAIDVLMACQQMPSAAAVSSVSAVQESIFIDVRIHPRNPLPCAATAVTTLARHHNQPHFHHRVSQSVVAAPNIL